MPSLNRRSFLRASTVIATAGVSDLSFLSRFAAAATETRIDPAEVIFGPETDRLLRVIRDSTREECVPAFAREIKAGLSYRQFLTVLFLAAVENGDPHQVAQVYGAHRISSDVRIEERLLPLFWVLNRIKQESETGAAIKSALRPFKGTLPDADKAEGLFREAMLASDSAAAERAILAVARDRGPRSAMLRLLEFAPRNVGDNLGHPAIALANGLRSLEVMGWQHAEVGLRYATGYLASYKGDRTFEANLERAKTTGPRLPQHWPGAAGDRTATLDLYKVIRSGEANAAGELICSLLLAGKVKAGSVWDAISLAAADTIFRYKTGGEIIGGAQIHAITTTNALRHGFHLTDHAETKLVHLLQAAGVTADFYVRFFGGKGNFRDIDLLDLKTSADPPTGTIREVFDVLPYKARGYNETDTSERAASDQACRMAFGHLGTEQNQNAFLQTARSLLCVKAGMDAHDIKYPAAAFEDAFSVSAEWRPYLLASSVHALHGTKSDDTAVLVQVRDALK